MGQEESRGQLPDPPPPVTITGPDGREHRLEFSVWLAPAGLAVELIEVRAGEGEGYRFSTIGPLDGPIDAHAEHLLATAQAEIGHQYLTSHGQDGRLLVAGEEVTGRLVWPAGVWDGDPDRYPYNVVIDGRQMTWAEFGKTLEPYEGWRFRLIIEDNVDQV